MANQHLGIDIQPKVNTNGIDKLYSLTDKLLGNTKKLGSAFKDLRFSSSVARGANKAKSETQEANKSAKEYQQTVDHVNGNGFKKITEQAKSAGKAASETGKQIQHDLGKEIKTKITVDNTQANNKTKETKHWYEKIPLFKKTTFKLNDQATKPLGKIDSDLNNTDRKAKQTSHSLKDIVVGSALGQGIMNGISNAASSMYNGFKSVVKEGVALNATTDKINASFKNMGMSSNDIKILDDQMGYLHKNVGLTGVQTSNLQKQMFNWSRIGKAGAEEMTTAVAAVGAGSRMSTDQIAKMGGQLMRVGSTGKVTASSLNRIVRNAPGLYAVLAKGAGMTQNQMKRTIATGKVTQAQFQRWLANGSKYASGIFKQYGKTVGGAQARIRAGWQDIEKQITKPLMSVRGSAAQQMANLMQSKAVQQGAHLLGEGIRNVAEWGMKGLGYLAKHRSDVVGTATDFVKIAGILAKDVWKDFSGIVFDLAKDFGLVKKNAKPGSGLHSFRQAMDGLAKNKGAINSIAHALIAIAALKGLTSVATSVKAISDAFGKDSAVQKVMGSSFVNGLRNTAGSHGKGAWLLQGSMQSLRSAGGFSNLTKAGQVATGVAGAGVAVDAGAQFVNAFKDRHSATKRSQDIGKGIGAGIGGGIGLYFGGPAGAAIGAQIGKIVGDWGGSAVNKFTKGWQRHKPPKRFWSLENLGWSTHNMFRQLGSAGGKMGRNIAKGWRHGTRGISSWFKNLPKSTHTSGRSISNWAKQTGRNIHSAWNNGLKSSHNFFKHLPSNFNNFKKSFGKNWQSFWRATGRWANASWNGTKRNWTNFWKYLPRNWHNFQKSFGKGWRSFWNGTASFFKGIVKGIESAWNHTIGAIAKGFENLQKFWHALPGRLKSFNRSAGNAIVKGYNNVQAFKNDISYGLGGSRHANKYLRTHAAGTASLVGEAGPELAYKPWAKQARILGANGPQLAKIKPNEKILNAKDTQKVMRGGLGRGLVLKGYASGTQKLGQTKKTVTSDYKQIQQNASKSLRKLKNDSRSNWTSIKSHSNKTVNQIKSHNNSTWRSITRQTDRQTNKTRRNTVSDYTNMRKGVNKQMNAIRSGVINTGKSTAKGYGKAVNKLVDYSRSAMKGTVKQLNRGISGIDKTLSQFGGNNSVIKPIHFATGSDSNGRLMHRTLAMVNDDYASRQESIVEPNGDLYIPRGKHRVLSVDAGAGILNGDQTQVIAHQMGLKHFAKGSGVSHSQLRKIADRGQANPTQMFGKMFISNIKSRKPNIQSGTTDLGKNSGKHYGVPWTEAMFTVIENAIGSAIGKGGTREAFLHYAESVFSGVPYQMGAASRRLSDCSGMVMQALRHFGIDIGRTTVAMQHSSGVEYLGKNINKTVPGDLVIFGHGTGAAGHVGIVKNPRTHSMFNETPPKARVTSIDDDTGMGYGFYRVRGLHNASPKHKTQRADKGLMRLAKRELGAKALKWIKDNLGDELGSLGAFALGGDVATRARILARALKQLDPRATKSGIAAILGNWSFESGLNPGAVNPGGGASGLGQWLGGRKSNLIAWSHRHGKNWKSAAAQLEFALKGDSSDSAIFRHILESGGSVTALANRFSSEWERGGYNAQHVAGAIKIRHALGYSSGGHPAVNTDVMVGENGPEVLRLKKPAKIFSNSESKKLSFDSLSSHVGRPKPARQQTPNITVNINGPISSPATANKYADMIDNKIAKFMEQMADQWGTDTALY